MFNLTTINDAFRMLQKGSCNELQNLYNVLGVTLSEKDYDPESWYGGKPHPFTGKILDKKYQIPAMIEDLIGTIKQGEPCCYEQAESCVVIWPKGSGKPVYSYSGMMGYRGYTPEKWYNHRTGEHNTGPKYGCGIHYEKGVFCGYEYLGLGVDLKTACKIWPESKLLNLPNIKDYLNQLQALPN